MKRFLGLLGFLAIFPFFLSRRSRVLRSRWIHAKPEELFPLIDTLHSWHLWSPWYQEHSDEPLELHEEGPQSGEGAAQSWDAPRANGTLRLIGSVPNRSVSYAFEMERKFGECAWDLSTEGVITLEAVGEGTRVTWACWWIGGENPYTRYFDLALRWQIGRNFGTGLANLKALAEEEAPEPHGTRPV